MEKKSPLKLCDCRPVESSTRWYYSNTEITNVEEPKVEYENVTYSLLSGYLSCRRGINRKTVEKRVALHRYIC